MPDQNPNPDLDAAIGRAYFAAASGVGCTRADAETVAGRLIRTAVESAGCAIAPPAAEGDRYTTTDLRDLSGADNPVVRDLAAALLRSRARVAESEGIGQEVREYLGTPAPFPEPAPDPESRPTATLGGQAGAPVEIASLAELNGLPIGAVIRWSDMIERRCEYFDGLGWEAVGVEGYLSDKEVWDEVVRDGSVITVLWLPGGER